MVQQLRDSKNEHTIQAADMNPNVAGRPENIGKIEENETNGIGTGTDNYYSPGETNITDGVESSSAMVLAHEFRHGADKDVGAIDRSPNPATGKPKSEEKAIKSSEQVRDYETRQKK